jgi:chorismate mutase/prephenate dehydrogenase
MSNGKEAILSRLSGRRLVIVGGNGQMGRLFRRYFQNSGLETLSLDIDNQEKAPEIVERAAVVVICVPIDVTVEVIAGLPDLSPQTILADLTSVKEKPLTAMLKRHPGPVIGLHPMFGPDISEMRDQRLIYCLGRNARSCAVLLDIIASWGIKLVETQAAEHDRNMAMIQAQRHFINFCLGSNLMDAGVDMEKLLAMGTPAFHLEMMQMGRFFSQQAELYADIIMASENNLTCIRNFCNTMVNLLELLENHDREAFIRRFSAICLWLGEYGNQLNRHSKIAFPKIISAINQQG